MPKMPIDLKKLIDSVANVGQQRDMPVHVELVFDPTASSSLVDIVLTAFASTGSNVKIVTFILEKTVPVLSRRADLCVIIGGDSLLLGDVVESADAMNTPAVVVIARGKTFFANDRNAAQAYADMTLAANAAPTPAGNAQAPSVGKPLALDDIIDVDVDCSDSRPLEELGTWIVQNAPGKRIPLAVAFPFLRHPLAVELAKQNTIQNGAIGIVFFMPGADMPLITLNQAKMVLQIAAVYGQPMNMDRAREVIAVVAGGFGCRAAARKITAQVPVLGWAVKPAVAASGTMAMAIAAIEYFEENGKLHGLSAVVDKVWAKAEPLVGKGADLVGSVVTGATTHA
jgi:uncharacterized protein (DUF697 family)